jgi:hypothetical protein
MNPNWIDKLNIVQDGTGNTQNNSFILAHGQKNQPIPSNVRRGSQNFVGREKELAEIHQKLQEGQGVIVCAVEGLGGVGKTELALQYADRYKEEYTAQYWFQLREMGLAEAVVQLALVVPIALPEAMHAARIEAQAQWYWQNCLPAQGKLLVILDDVAKAESMPDEAMPFDPRVQILVTTRERSLQMGFESVPLAVLTEGEALELLRKIVGVGKVDRELATVQQICQTLGYLPLAIELVGEYLAKNRFLTFAELQERLHLADESIARERKHKFYAYRGVAAAIRLSWDDLSATSQRVAMLLGLFAPVDILWELVEGIRESVEITKTELNEARGQLDNLHLIQPIDEENKFYKIHTLVREFFRIELSQKEENNQFRQAFVTHLLEIANNIHPLTNDKIRIAAYASPHITLARQEMSSNIYNSEDDLSLKFAESAIYLEGNATISLVIEGE